MLSVFFLLFSTLRWLGLVLAILGAILVFAAALFAVIGRSTGISAGLVGLSISYALQVSNIVSDQLRELLLTPCLANRSTI